MLQETQASVTRVCFCLLTDAYIHKGHMTILLANTHGGVLVCAYMHEIGAPLPTYTYPTFVLAERGSTSGQGNRPFGQPLCLTMSQENGNGNGTADLPPSPAPPSPAPTHHKSKQLANNKKPAAVKAKK